jgi:hypothetical protein
MRVLEIINILLTNLQHLLQCFFMKSIFLCATFIVCVVLIIAKLYIIITPTQLLCMFWKSLTCCKQMFNICCNFFVWSLFFCARLLSCVWLFLLLEYVQLLHQCNMCAYFGSHWPFANKCSTFVPTSICEVQFLCTTYFSCVALMVVRFCTTIAIM